MEHLSAVDVGAPVCRQQAEAPSPAPAVKEPPSPEAARPLKEPVSDDMAQMVEDLRRYGLIPEKASAPPAAVPEVLQVPPPPPTDEQLAGLKEPISDDMAQMVEDLRRAGAPLEGSTPAPRALGVGPEPPAPEAAAPTTPSEGSAAAPSTPAAEPALPTPEPRPALASLQPAQAAPIDPWSRLIHLKPVDMGPVVREQMGLPPLQDNYALL
ncbi:MAG TPA: hypothetical protein VNO81_06605, partial [Candidatus Nitrosotenuis sp.]|nr:hypothetical protein [Candidatus Nitrosotenuis sp.]